MKRNTVERKIMIVAKLKTTPLVSTACASAKVSRATFYRWLIEDPDFAEMANNAIKESRDEVNQYCESRLLDQIKKDRLGAIIFWLRTFHPDYQFKNKY